MKKLFLTALFPILILSAVFADSNLTAQKEITIYNFDELNSWLSKDNDSIYVINFWATWCAPCVKEIPYFEKINALYRDQKVKVLMVSLDFPRQIESRLIPFIERMEMKAEVVLLDDTNANRWIPLVDENWTGAIPATLIYNQNFRGFYAKEFNFEELEEIILPLMN